jgi:hypothetical protein
MSKGNKKAAKAPSKFKNAANGTTYTKGATAAVKPSKELNAKRK